MLKTSFYEWLNDSDNNGGLTFDYMMQWRRYRRFNQAAWLLPDATLGRPRAACTPTWMSRAEEIYILLGSHTSMSSHLSGYVVVFRRYRCYWGRYWDNHTLRL